MPKPRRVLSLLRVFGKPQIDRTGIPRQEDSIRQILEAENLVVEDGDEYRFEGLSGASVDRFPKYMAMLSRLSDEKIAGIVFADVSRLFRPEFVDQLGISKPFRVNGKLMFYEEGILDLRKDRDMGIFISEAMKAGAYRKRMLKNTQWGRNERRKRGDCKSDPLPKGVGFKPHPKLKDELVVGHFYYTDDAKRMKDAFRRVLEGESYSKIAKDLNFYSASELRDYLRSRWWVGDKASFKIRINAGLRDDGTAYSGYRAKRDVPVGNAANGIAYPCALCDVHDEPLISREIFEAVQSILNKTGNEWIQVTEAGDSLPYIGKGVLVCARCGRKLYTKPNKKNQKFYYRCSSYNNKNTPCGAPHIHQEEIDRELRVYATLRMTDKTYIESLTPAEPPSANTALLEKQKALAEKRLDNLYAMLGDPTKDQNRIEKQIQLVTQQGKDLDDLIVAAAKPIKATINPQELRQRFKNFGKLSITEQRDAIRKTFAKVIVDYDDETDKPSIVRVELRLSL